MIKKTIPLLICSGMCAALFLHFSTRASAVSPASRSEAVKQFHVEVQPLQAMPPIPIPGKAGWFDYMAVDASMHRLYAAHSGAGTLAALDLRTHTVLNSPAVGSTHGVEIDARHNLILLGSSEKQVVELDRKTLAQQKTVDTPEGLDAIAYDSTNGLLYCDGGHKPQVFVVDPAAGKLLKTISLPGDPEYIVYDPAGKMLYQNIESGDAVVSINPATGAVGAEWPTAPATQPHGLAIDGKTRRLFSAGANGELAVIDARTGRLITSVAIAKGPDQIAFDPGTRRVYCACRGFLSVVQETARGARLLGNVPTPPGAHTLAVDPATHAVWIAFPTAGGSSFEEYRYVKRTR